MFDSISDYELRRLAKVYGITKNEINIDSSSSPKERKNHVSNRTNLMGFLSLPLPLLFNAPIIVLTIMNPCLNYVKTLDISLIVLYCVGFALCVVHTFLYNYYTYSCSSKSYAHHAVHLVILYSSMGATLAFYNLYTYEPSVIYYLCAFISSLTTIVEYFVCLFHRRDFYYCHDETCNDLDAVLLSDYTSIEDLFTAFGVFFILIWCTIIILPVSLSAELYELSSMRSLTACKPI